MKDKSTLKGVVPVSRRNVLKAGAATAAGAGVFSGIAAATNPKQINFCGCSQVCVERDYETDGGTFYVIRAYEEDGEWVFTTKKFAPSDSDYEHNSFCFDVEGTDPEEKIIGVKKGTLKSSLNPDKPLNRYIYGNPNQCAQKALDELFSRGNYILVNDEDRVNGKEEDGYLEPIFGSGINDPLGGTVEIAQGRCGKPGREDKSQGPKDNGNNGNNGE